MSLIERIRWHGRMKWHLGRDRPDGPPRRVMCGRRVTANTNIEMREWDGEPDLETICKECLRYVARRASELPIDSMGECKMCGYRGPGPGHDCAWLRGRGGR